MSHGGRIDMMIVMRKDAEPADVQYIVDKLAEAGAEGHVSSGDVVTVIGVIGDREVISVLPLEAYPGVDKVLPILRPFKLVSREFRNSRLTSLKGRRMGKTLSNPWYASRGTEE